MSDMKSKSAMCRDLGWSPKFFDSIPLPSYPVGKRKRYRLCDVEPTLQRIKQESKWESTKSRDHLIIGTTSQSGVIDFATALRQTTEMMP